MEKGAVITKINNRDILNTLDLKDELYKCSAGEKIVVNYVKNGRLYSGTTTLR